MCVCVCVSSAAVETDKALYDLLIQPSCHLLFFVHPHDGFGFLWSPNLLPQVFHVGSAKTLMKGAN